MSMLTKPEKINLNNTNLLYALTGTHVDYIFRSIPTHFRIDTFQFQTESWPFKTTFFMSVCPKNRYQTGWKDYKLKQNIPNSGAYPFKGTFFRSIPVHVFRLCPFTVCSKTIAKTEHADHPNSVLVKAI